MKQLLNNIRKMFESRIPGGAIEKQPGWEKRHSKNSGVVPTTWKDMLENALSDTVNWQTRKWSKFTKFQVLAWMTINSNRMNSNQLDKCHKFAHKSYYNACNWHELDDLTFNGRSTSLQDQSQNGLRHVTDDYLV